LAARVPLIRLAVYILLLVVCGAVAGHELYFLLAGNKTVATILRTGKTTVAVRRSRYWAEYEYVDQQGNRHVGQARIVPPVISAGEHIEIQYLVHAPATSRVAPAPAKGWCFGAVALLAATVFTAEILVSRRRRLAGKDPESNQV
jgi:hypothetical protein